MVVERYIGIKKDGQGEITEDGFNSAFKKDCKTYALEKSVILGWKSVANFTFEDEMLKFNSGFTLGTGKKTDITDANIVGKAFSQASTQGISTCTFVYLSNGEDIWLFHLDVDCLNRSEIDDVLGCLKIKVESGQKKYKCIVSHIDDEDEKRFVEKIRGNEAICELYTFNRGKVAITGTLGHVEIGVCVDGGGLVLFGDVSKSFGDRKEFFGCTQDKKEEDKLQFKTFQKLQKSSCTIL